jgi:hypothetical protein
MFTVVTMKNVVFWDVMPRSSRKDRRFGGTYRLHISVLQLPGSANAVPSSLSPFTLMIEAIRSAETSDLTRATQYHTPEVGILEVFV